MNLNIKLFFLFLLPLQLLAINHWNKKANFGGDARHRASAFTIGDKGYIGMGHVNSAQHIIYKDIWEYDPATNSWTQKADFGGGLRYQCTAFSIDNEAYMGLGRNPQNTYEKDFWKFNPISNTWYPIAEFPGEERRGASGFTIDGKGYVGLGQATSGYANDFYEYSPNSNSWTQKADFIGLPRTSAVSFVNNNKAYVGTGHTYSLALKDFYEFIPSSNHWTQKADVGDSLRQDAAGFVLNNEGYLGTGNNVDGSINYKDFLKYNFETDEWRQVEDFMGAARRYMVSFVIRNTAYCGTGTNGTNLNDFWSYDPTLSITDIDYSEVRIYPNPSTNLVRFTNLQLNSKLIVFNQSGQIVYQEILESSETKIEKNEIGVGVYIYQIINDNTTSTGKFIFIK